MLICWFLENVECLRSYRISLLCLREKVNFWSPAAKHDHLTNAQPRKQFEGLCSVGLIYIFYQPFFAFSVSVSILSCLVSYFSLLWIKLTFTPDLLSLCDAERLAVLINAIKGVSKSENLMIGH